MELSYYEELIVTHASLHGNLCCLHRVISIESQLVEIHFNIIFLNSCKRDNLKLVFKMSNIRTVLVLILFDAKWALLFSYHTLTTHYVVENGS